MILKKNIKMLLPTAQYANVQIEVGAEVDTNDYATTADAQSFLNDFVEQEIFATKEALEGRPAKDFKLTTTR